MRLSGIANWKWALWAAVAVTLLSAGPQLLMWGSRGAQWNGTYAELHGDEWVYSAYVQALIDGRPRRNDPYTGRDDRPDNVQPESLFSIQFLPAYVIAIPARLLGISSSTAFIVLGVLAPFFACLSIYWLIAIVIRDRNLAAAGSVVVLCLGALAAGEGLIHLLISGDNYSFLPFLRRYVPVAPFPLFFVFCTIVWKALNDRRFAFVCSVTAGLLLDLLIFSYFFLWTAALAWLACIALLWFVAYPRRLRQDSPHFLIILLLAVTALVLHPRWLLAFVAVTPIVVGAALSRPDVQLKVYGGIQAAARQHAGHIATAGYVYKLLDERLYEERATVLDMHFDEAGRFIVRALEGYVTVPLPWQARSASALAYLPEQVIWYIIVALAPIGLVFSFRRDPLVAGLLFGFAVVAAVTVAMTSGNVGTLVRHRGLALPYVVWLSAVGACELVTWSVAALPLRRPSFNPQPFS